jgi:T5SS/PEP-CTERM-associated repeat protein
MSRHQLRRPSHTQLLAALAIACSLAIAPTLPAETIITGDVTPSLPWDSETDAYIGNTGSGTLTVSAGNELALRYGYLGYDSDAAGEATITGPDSQWNSTVLRVGSTGSGTLHVEDGGQVTSIYAYLGHSAGSTGAATISGTGSQWNNDNELYVGRDGNGTLVVEDGGLISNTSTFNITAYLGYDQGTTGEVTITGSGSQWNNSGGLYVGRKGSGTLRVEDGGRVSNGDSYLGYYSGSTGEAIVTGPCSRWDGGYLFVGREGNGTLTVENGGQVTALGIYASLDSLHGNGAIAATTGAVLDADLRFDASQPAQNHISFGAGGTLSITAAGGDLGVGYRGHGSLAIADGVTVASYHGYLGYSSGSTGEATITGPGSQWNSDSRLIVGNLGSGTLRVEHGGRVSNKYGYLGLLTGSTGEVTITGTGSQWSNSSDLSVNRGTLTITEGGLVTVGGVLSVDFIGYVNMSTGGMLALLGDADDSLAQFLDIVEGTDAIRYWNDGLADWALLTGATYGDDYTLQYLTTGGLAGYTLLTVGTPLAGLAGDFNGDGTVDAADYSVWRDGLGTTYTEADYQVWKSHFGQTAGSGSLMDHPVPEPSTMVLFLFGALAMCRRCAAGRRCTCARWGWHSPTIAFMVGNATLQSLVSSPRHGESSTRGRGR